LTPSAGEIRIGGTPVTGCGMDRGVVFQDFAQRPTSSSLI
jgi:ABC-type taurine transport system ATPase subunit